MNVKTWPHEHTMSEDEGALRGRLQGRSFTLTRVNSSWLNVQLHDDEDDDGTPAQIVVGVEDSARTIRFIPTLGPLPLLIFPKTRLLCPPQNTLPVVLSLPLYLRMGIGSGQRFALVSELEPPHMMRALYGPVDAGRLCRSIHSDIAFTPEEAQALHAASQPQLSDEDTFQLAPPPACVVLKIYNAMSEPLEVSKIMIPVELLSLYQGPDGTPQTTSMKMRLFGQQEAEISSDKIPDHTTPIADMNGTMPSPSRGSWMFSHSYRNKTGLEFGF